jgi:hypothetical protein
MHSEWPEDITHYLQQSLIPIRLACTTKSGWPMVLSLWYLYEDHSLYCATVETARVVAYLSHEPRCAFEVASDQIPYCGIRGQANAVILPERGNEILKRLLHRYLGGIDNPLSRILLSRDKPEVAIQLRPINLFSWNFRDRMQGIPSEQDRTRRICPVGSHRIDLST